jgi:hypothetical protein
MATTTKERPDFIPYPTNRVVGTLADAKSAHAAINALLEAGFDRQDIDILHGDEDIQRLDPTGEEHGFLAQTPIGKIRRPGSRTTVFSFVAHRVGVGWLCGSAHNTDVVPHMETNIVDDEGAFRAANYQDGQVS